MGLSACARQPKPQKPEAQPRVEVKEADVVVVGAGGAGLAAAVTAAENGARVIVVEKMPMIGGNTLRATGGVNAAGTKYQQAMGISDSPEIHYQDTMKGGYNKNIPELVRTMVNEAPKAVDWLISLGADLTRVGISGGSTNARSHGPKDGSAVGPEIMKALKAAADAKKDQIEILLETRATEILMKDGKAVGIKAQGKNGEIQVNAKAVILATGGFGANPDMVAKYQPRLKGFDTTNQPGATGDGITMAQAVGAALIQMEEIQTHPTVVPKKGIMITEGVRGEGAILVNRQGKRFVDELQTRDVVSEAILKQEGGTAFLVFDQQVRDNLKAIETYVKQGLITEANSVEELAKALKIDEKALAATVTAYNGFVKAKKDAEFGRKHMKGALTKSKFYAVEVTPAVHHTMGGVRINTRAEVLKEDGTAIPGLFAAGEVTGGVHGGNRLGGNAVADIIVFGRIAGQNAAATAKSK
ncbi:MAG TPA: flavocytochrome c [Firmicutes bacterium]|nr:flavocytochrome c [Bacillota bacterium]